MSGNDRKNQSVPELLIDFWGRGFFSSERNLQSIQRACAKLGFNPSDKNLRMALARSKFLTQRGKRGSVSYVQKYAPRHLVLNRDIFPDDLIIALGKDFDTELDDLRWNYGKSGNCTAFVLRKILEKLIFLAFAKNGLEDKLQDNTRPGNLVGLNAMLELAKSNKVNGKPFLTSRTADEVHGIKFLGDTSAHNPLVNVPMKTIDRAMPFIVIAYSELATKLKGDFKKSPRSV